MTSGEVVCHADLREASGNDTHADESGNGHYIFIRRELENEKRQGGPRDARRHGRPCHPRRRVFAHTDHSARVHAYKSCGHPTAQKDHRRSSLSSLDCR